MPLEGDIYSEVVLAFYSYSPYLVLWQQMLVYQQHLPLCILQVPFRCLCDSCSYVVQCVGFEKGKQCWEALERLSCHFCLP